MSTITTIQSTDAVSDSRAVINTNFDNLNTDVITNSAKVTYPSADSAKLAGIEAGADVTDTANVASAGALMDSELASIADVKALDQSVVSGASPVFNATNFTNLPSGTPEGTAIKSTGEAGGTKFLREDGDDTCSWQEVAAGGDVVGPASAVDSNFASFDTTTGKLIKDSTSKASDFASALGADDNYVTDAEKVVIGNTSGTNSGDEASASVTVEGIVELTTTAEIDTGTDSTRAMVTDQFVASKRNVRTVIRDVMANDTDHTVVADLAGDFVMPIAGTIIEVGCIVDTAGTTGLGTYDINKNGTTILSTKITIDSTEKTSRTAATAPVISVTSVAEGDIITFDTDVIQTTPAKGLQFFIKIRE